MKNGSTVNGRKLIAYMESKGWRVSPLNIVYLEDANADTWQPVQKQEQPDAWNDVRILVRNDGEVIMSAQATVEPGRYYTEHRMNDKGAFRIASDVQFTNAWTIGSHKKQLALVQCLPVRGYRDNNEDYIRPGDPVDEGIFGINQHTTGDNSSAPVPEKIGKWSAGCLVGRYASTHYNVFMPELRKTRKAQFDTCIIPGDKFANFS